MSLALTFPMRLAIERGSGAMVGSTTVKRTNLGDLVGLYADRVAFEELGARHGGDVAYEVQEFRPHRVVPYELVFGTSTLQPGSVGEEFFMTRGHIHLRADRPEPTSVRAGAA